MNTLNQIEGGSSNNFILFTVIKVGRFDAVTAFGIIFKKFEAHINTS